MNEEAIFRRSPRKLLLMSGVNVSVCAICSSVTSGLDLLSYFVCLFGSLSLFGLLDVLGWLSSDCTCLLGFIDISCFFALPCLADLLVFELLALPT